MAGLTPIMQAIKASTPGKELKRPRAGRKRRRISAPSTGPAAFIVEMMAVVTSGASNHTPLMRQEPRKIPGQRRAPPTIAAMVAIAVGSQIGAGNNP